MRIFQNRHGFKCNSKYMLKITVQLAQIALNKHQSYTGAAREIGCHRDTLAKFARENGILFVPKKYSHSPESRKKMSEMRREYLKSNPDKHPWRNHTKFRSEPCEKVKDWLKSKGIDFIPEYRIEASKYNYSLDIAFPDKLIAIEINGNQHYNRDGTLKEYYQKRHEYIESLGWTLYELHYSICFKLDGLDRFTSTLLSCCPKSGFIYKAYIPPAKPIKSTRSRYGQKYQYPAMEDILDMVKTKSLAQIAREIGVPYGSFVAKIWRLRKSGAPIPSLTGNPRLEAKCDIQFHHRRIELLCSCGCSKCEKARYCRDCANLKRRKYVRPSCQELEALVTELPMTSIGRKYGVSDNAVRKWCRSYGIAIPSRKA